MFLLTLLKFFLKTLKAICVCKLNSLHLIDNLSENYIHLHKIFLCKSHFVLVKGFIQFNFQKFGVHFVTGIEKLMPL